MATRFAHRTACPMLSDPDAPGWPTCPICGVLASPSTIARPRLRSAQSTRRRRQRFRCGGGRRRDRGDIGEVHSSGGQRR